MSAAADATGAEVTNRDRWNYHVGHCSQCATVDFKLPATLARLCLTGARLYKESIAQELQRRRSDVLHNS